MADAGDLGFPHVTCIARIRRDGYNRDGQLISKEIAHTCRYETQVSNDFGDPAPTR